METYPLTIETGETFLTDEQVLRFVGEKCGDEMARMIRARFFDGPDAVRAAHALSKLRGSLESIGGCVSELEDYVSAAEDIIEGAIG